MPPALFRIGKADFDGDTAAFTAPEFMQATKPAPESAAEPLQDDSPIEHHSRICPTCGNRLTGYRCKLVCARCGYYLSCADYY